MKTLQQTFVAEYHSIPIINWGLLLGIILGRREENWGSFSGSVSCRGRFRDHFRVGNNVGVGDHFGGCTGVRMQSFINLG